jgi:hypothetical protein
MTVRDDSSSSASPRRRRNQQLRTRRYEPTSVYALAADLKRKGVELHKFRGPWHPVRRTLRRAGRNSERAMSVVTNGVVEIAVDTAEHAVDLSGFLNSTGVEHLEPVPNLRPPDQDVVRE